MDGESHVLPPFGFYATDGEGFLEYSKRVGRQRIEFVDSPEYLYIDTRDAFVRLPKIAARGALSFKKENERSWWLIPATDCQDFCIYTKRMLPGTTISQVKITALAENGEDLGAVEPRMARDGLSFKQTPGAIKYKIEFLEEPETPLPELRLSLKSREWEVGEGQTFPVQATVWNFSRSRLTDVLLRLTPEGRESLAKEKQIKPAVAPQSALTTEFHFTMPSDALETDRLWIRGEAKGKINGEETTATAGLDFRPMPAIQINLFPQEPVEARPGKKVTFRLELTSYLRWDYSSNIEVWPASSTAEPIARRKMLLRRGRTVELPFTVTVPGQEEVTELTATIEAGSARHEQKLLLKATVAPEVEHALHDLTAEPTWGYRFRGEKDVTGDVSSGATFTFGENSCGGIGMEGFFAHPPYIGGVGYAFGRFVLDLPTEPALLKFSTGLRDGSTSHDGVVYRVTAKTDGARERLLFEKHWHKTEWSEEAVDLSQFAGQKITLTLITDVGPSDNSNSDWACWGNPRIVLTGRRMSLQLLHPEPQHARP